jgi:hypothetical protein
MEDPDFIENMPWYAICHCRPLDAASTVTVCETHPGHAECMSCWISYVMVMS